MASTADIQVRANRGRTTQELHRDALKQKERDGGLNNKTDGVLFLVPKVFYPFIFSIGIKKHTLIKALSLEQTNDL